MAGLDPGDIIEVDISFINFEVIVETLVEISAINFSAPQSVFNFAGAYFLNPLRIELTWEIESYLSYNLFKWSDTTGDWVSLISSEISSYTDPFVVIGTTYRYKLSTFSLGSPSTYSEEISVTIPGETEMGISRGSIYQGIQLGVETTPGTKVPANRRLVGMTMEQTPNIPISTVKFNSAKGSTGTQKGQEYTEVKWDGAMDFNLLTYVACHSYGTVAPSIDTNTVKAATYHWNPSTIAPLPHPRTSSWEQGSVVGAEGFPYGMISGFTFKWSKTESSISGSMFGQKQLRNGALVMTPRIKMTVSTAGVMGDVTLAVTTDATSGTIPAGTYYTAAGKVFTSTADATITGSAATLTTSALVTAIALNDVAFTIDEVASVPVQPTSVGVYYSLDGNTWTAFNSTIEGQFALEGLWEPDFHQNDNTGSTNYDTYDKITELQPAWTAQISFEEGSEANSMFTDLENGTLVFLGWKTIGPIIDPTAVTKHMIRLYMPFYVTKPAPGEKNNVVDNTFTFEFAHNLPFGMFDLTIVNRLLHL